MEKLVIHHEKISDVDALVKLCPFGAMENKNGRLDINAACKMCRLCVKKSNGAVTVENIDEAAPAVDKSLWNGIMVYADHVEGVIHPVTYELIGKAREMADSIGQQVYVLMIGYNVEKQCAEILHYGVDKVFLFDHPELERFNIETYTNVTERVINDVKPGTLLVGATPAGRQFAPRIGARLKAGITADCTVLNMNPDTDLDQIRPAFGGNIMAHIKTPNTRPQIATVRYKIMDAPLRRDIASGEIVKLSPLADELKTSISVLNVASKPKEHFIEDASVLVVAGRGVSKEADVAMISELADLLGGQLACTRPMAESGMVNAKHQIGLSGRTVRPDLIITCGVSGAIQFVAGMNKSKHIIAINKDPAAPIFNVAHTCIVGDLYEIVPALIEMIKKERKG